MSCHHADEMVCPVRGCGSLMEWESCWQCYGMGGFHDCGEDCCCCADPDDLNEPCMECDGRGWYHVCPRAGTPGHGDTETGEAG